MSSYWDEVEDPDDSELDPPAPNKCRLGGLQLPGLVELPEGEPERKIDLKNGPGRDGATATWQGYELPEIKLTLRMWRARHRLEWRRILPQILPRPGKPPSAPFSIQHVALSDYGISHVMVQKISLPKQGKAQGEVEVTLTLREWRAPFAGTGTGTSTPTQAAAGAPATVHETKGGRAPALIGPPAPPAPPYQFNPPQP